MPNKTTKKDLKNLIPPMTTGQISIQDLPDEMTLRILSFLEPPALCNVSRVSKNINQLANDNALWKRFFIDSKDKALSSYKSAKKAFEALPAQVEPQFRTFSVCCRISDAEKTLKEIDALESSSALFAKKKLSTLFSHCIKEMHAKKNFLHRIFSHGKKEGYDLNKAKKLVHEIDFSILNVLNRILKKIQETDSFYGPGSALQILYSNLQEIGKNYGIKAAIFSNPAGLENIIRLMDEYVLDDLKIMHLADALVHKDIVMNPALPEIINQMIAWLQNPDNTKYGIMNTQIGIDSMVAASLRDIKPEFRRD